MSAISPFSLIDKLGAGKVAGAVADLVADTARQATRPGGTLGTAFSEIWDRLDANDDGRLTGRDALGHAVKAGAWTLDSVGKAMGLEMERGSTGSAGSAASRAAEAPAEALTTPAEMMLAATSRGADAPGSLAGTSGTARENLPAAADLSALDTIRATYQTLRAARF
jgi:hypothetical protein